MNPLMDPQTYAKPPQGGMSAGVNAVQNPLGAVPPQPMPQQSSMPMQVQPKAPTPNPFERFAGSFAKGFIGPERAAQIDAQRKAAAQEQAKAALIWMQQTAAQPAERRAAFTLQSAQDIARDTGQPYEAIVASARDPSAFSDEKLNGAIAKFSAMAGIAPSTPDYQFLQGPDGAISVGDKGAGTVRQLQPGAPKPRNPLVVNGTVLDPETMQPLYTAPEKPVRPNLPDGWQMGPNGPEAIPGYAEWYRKMHPQAPSSGAARMEDVSPAEMEARGYPKGTIGQRNTVTNEIEVKSRPSTQMTGQPTESERKYALYASNAKDALTVIDKLEFGGDYADGAKPIWERGNQLNPFDETARKYDQATDRFLDSWARAMTGAAMTKEEKEFYYSIIKPTFGDSEDVRIQKAQARHKMAGDLEVAAARGMNPYNTMDQHIDSLFPADGGDDDLSAAVQEGRITPDEADELRQLRAEGLQ